MTRELLQELFDDLFNERIYFFELYYDDENDTFCLAISYDKKTKKYICKNNFIIDEFNSVDDFICNYIFPNGKRIEESYELLGFED